LGSTAPVEGRAAFKVLRLGAISGGIAANYIFAVDASYLAPIDRWDWLLLGQFPGSQMIK
jgi:hypothetical protein